MVGAVSAHAGCWISNSVAPKKNAYGLGAEGEHHGPEKKTEVKRVVLRQRFLNKHRCMKTEWHLEPGTACNIQVAKNWNRQHVVARPFLVACVHALNHGV